MKQVMRGKSVLSDRRFDSKIKKLFFVWWFAWRSIYASESKLEKIRLACGILYCMSSPKWRKDIQYTQKQQQHHH